MTVMIQSARRLIAGLLCSLAVFGFSTLGLAGESGFARPVVDDAIPAYTAKTGVSGAVAIAGSDTMQPIIAKIASAFRQWQADVKIAVQGGGTDAAVLQFLQNQSIIRRGDGSPKGGHQVSGSVALLAASVH